MVKASRSSVSSSSALKLKEQVWPESSQPKTIRSDWTRTQRPPIDPPLPRPPNPDPTLLTQKHQGSSSANGLAARAVFLNYCLVQIYVQSGISGAYEVLFLVF